MPIRFNCKENCIAEIDIDLGEKNTFNISEINELIKTFEKYIEREIDLKAILIKSSNPGYFATGPKIKEIAGLDKDGARYYITLMNVLTKHIIESPLPVICAIRGAVSGIGLDIASSCDFRLAEKNAAFSDLSSKYGLFSPSYLSLRLAFLIGVQRASEIVFSSKVYSAGDLYRFNFLTDLFVEDEFDKGIEKFVNEFKSLSVDSLRLKKKVFTDLWKNYLRSNQFPADEIFFELLREGKDWKKSKIDFIENTL